LDQEERERLYQQAQSGDRKRVALEELNSFLNWKGEALVGALPKVRTPEDAYGIACEYRILIEFVGEANAAIAIGDNATKELMEERI
jgi:hypothetical protein